MHTIYAIELNLSPGSVCDLFFQVDQLPLPESEIFSKHEVVMQGTLSTLRVSNPLPIRLYPAACMN
jgi:hypothetical protein